MASGATDVAKDLLAGHSRARSLRRGGKKTLKVRDPIDEVDPVPEGRTVLGVGHRVTLSQRAFVSVRGILLRDEPVREPEFIERGIGREGEYGRYLRLPAKAADSIG